MCNKENNSSGGGSGGGSGGVVKYLHFVYCNLLSHPKCL